MRISVDIDVNLVNVTEHLFIQSSIKSLNKLVYSYQSAASSKLTPGCIVANAQENQPMKTMYLIATKKECFRCYGSFLCVWRS